MKPGELTRAQFAIAQAIIAAIRCASAMYEESDTEGTSSQDELDAVVDYVMQECSRSQAENLYCIIDRLLAKTGSLFTKSSLPEREI